MNQQNGGKNKNEIKEKLIGAEWTNSMKKLQKCPIQRLGLPSELLNELFAALPLENAFEILVGMSNGLLARNVRKMLKSVEMAMKGNKWNEADCGPKFTISDEGLMVKHLGPNGINCIRSILPIAFFNLNGKKSSIACYFEVEIVSMDPNICNGIGIGFCTRQFPLEFEWLGRAKNSIGTDSKTGMWINGQVIIFGNSRGMFKTGDVVGVGLIHSSANSRRKCFATCNGQLLETFELPDNFASRHLFPALTLAKNGDSICANFGQKKWCYNPNELLE